MRVWMQECPALWQLYEHRSSQLMLWLATLLQAVCLQGSGWQRDVAHNALRSVPGRRFTPQQQLRPTRGWEQWACCTASAATHAQMRSYTSACRPAKSMNLALVINNRPHKGTVQTCTRCNMHISVTGVTAHLFTPPRI